MSKLNLRDAALKLFNQKGYDAASIRDITKAAGLSTSTFYSHYAAKEDIYFDVMEECYNDLSRIMNKVKKETCELPADQQLFAQIEARVKFFYQGDDHYFFLVRNIIFPPDSLRVQVRQRLNEWEEHLFGVAGDIFELGQRQGLIAHYDPMELSRSVIRLIAGYGIQLIIMQETLQTSRKTLQKAWETYMLGLKPR